MSKSRILIATVASVILSSVALADGYEYEPAGKGFSAPPGTWTGFYGGVHVGIGAFTGKATDWHPEGAFGDGNFSSDSEVTGQAELRDLAILGGGQVGFNFQSGSIVYGLEGDFSWTAFGEDKTFNNSYVKAEMDWLATVRARLGVTSGNAMAYITGGLAIANVSHCANAEALSPCSNENVSSGEPAINDDDEITDIVNVAWDGTKVGLALGAGVEAALSDRLSIKGEYLYVAFDSENIVHSRLYDSDRDIDFSSDAHLFRVGLNHHLNDLPGSGMIESGPWSGAYGGVHAGVGAFAGRAMDWGDTVFSHPDGGFELKEFDMLGGVQAGYNIQSGNMVFGLEGDFAMTSHNEGRVFGNWDNYLDDAAGSYLSSEMEWLATLRARFGLAEGNAMAYVTGGLALAQVDYCAAKLDPVVPNPGNKRNRNEAQAPCIDDNPYFATTDGIQLGLVAGAGVEARLSENLSLKGEYLFVQLDGENVVYGDGVGQNVDFSSQAHLLRAGLNYHFDGIPLEEEPAPGPWSGVYAGVHGGAGAFAGRNVDWDANISWDTSGTMELEEFAALGGAQVGFNIQRGNVVYGLEGDWSWTGHSTDREVGQWDTINPEANQYPVVYIKSEMDWLATVRGRLGLAKDNAMFYVTGGLAIADVKYCGSYLNSNHLTVGGNKNVKCGRTNTPDEDEYAKFDDVTFGIVMGAGAEVRLSERLSLKGEFLFVQMDNENEVYCGQPADDNSCISAGWGEGEDVDFSSRVHIARIGLNYKLGGGW